MTSKFNKQNNIPNVSVRYAKVVIDFQPSVIHEVLLTKGDVVKVINDVDEFWYDGQVLNNGSQGDVGYYLDCIYAVFISYASGGGGQGMKSWSFSIVTFSSLDITTTTPNYSHS